MKTTNRKTLEALVAERLAAIGAANIPPGARDLIEGDAWDTCTRIVRRTVTGPRVGRAVARALAKNAGDTKTDDGQLPLFKDAA